MSNLSFDAMCFAREVHKDQRRKYGGDPYICHLAEAAGIVASVCDNWAEPAWDGWTEVTLDEVIATAWLHDCVEDQGVTDAQLALQFGEYVTFGVMKLSDTEQGNRAERKAASRARLAGSPGWVQTIKVADLVSNTSSIVQHDPKFARVYLAEKSELLDVLTLADKRLVQIAREQVRFGLAVIGIYPAKE